MKKSRILLAVLLTAALVSCQETEFGGNEYIPKKGDVVFKMKGNGRTTKSVDSATPSKGVTIDMSTENGPRLYLEETVINLDDMDFGPQTKGTPAYTENLGQLYANNLGVHADKGTFGDFAYESAEDEVGSDGKWLFKHNYSDDPWPNNDTPVGFYLRMPASSDDVTFGKDAYSDGSITFTYKSPSTAAETKDILFGYRSMAKKDYPSSGIPAVLFHALTGVKFAIGNEDDGIVITEVSFEGLYDGGTCTITPADIATEAAESYNVASWTPTSSEDFTITAGNLANAEGVQQIADYSKSENYDFPDSFYAAGDENNLNDNDATKTFWLIPQAFAEGSEVTLTIKYNYGDKTGLETTLLLGEILAERNIEWKAGELRTYTIRVADVNVKIDDQVTMSDDFETSQDWTDAAGSTKHSVKIKNTGNTPAYIRAAIVGQWLDEKGKPVFAFTDYKDTGIEIIDVPSWYLDQFGSSKAAPTYNFGYFSKLVGYDASSVWNDAEAYDDENGKWVKGSDDGYYYYTDAVPAGEYVPEDLFESYTMTLVPDDLKVGGVPQKVTFVLEVATQAISANQSNGATWNSYSDAWDSAKTK